MPQADLEVLWRLADGQALRHYAWDGEILLFNDLSGNTHLLDGTALAVLLALQAGPQREAALACSAGLDSSPADCDTLPALLADLEVLSLIQTAC